MRWKEWFYLTLILQASHFIWFLINKDFMDLILLFTDFIYILRYFIVFVSLLLLTVDWFYLYGNWVYTQNLDSSAYLTGNLLINKNAIFAWFSWDVLESLTLTTLYQLSYNVLLMSFLWVGRVFWLPSIYFLHSWPSLETLTQGNKDYKWILIIY